MATLVHGHDTPVLPKLANLRIITSYIYVLYKKRQQYIIGDYTQAPYDDDVSVRALAAFRKLANLRVIHPFYSFLPLPTSAFGCFRG
jgi:hypothetical protein